MLKQSDIKLFVYTGKLDKRIILIKKTDGMNLQFASSEFDCFEIAGNLHFNSELNGYHNETGFFDLPKLKAEIEVKKFEL